MLQDKGVGGKLFLGGKHFFQEEKGEKEREAVACVFGLPSAMTPFFLPDSFSLFLELLFSHYTQHVKESGKTHFLYVPPLSPQKAKAFAFFASLGCHTKALPLTKEGVVDVEALPSLLGPRVSLLSMEWACPLTGVVQPVEEVAALCAEKGVSLHLDVSSAFGKGLFLEEALPISYVSFTEERGESVLFVGQEVRFLGEEKKIEFSALSAFLSRAKEQEARGDFFAMEMSRCRSLLEEGIQKKIPGASILFQEENRLAHISVVCFPGVFYESLLFLLGRQGLFPSWGEEETSLSSLLQLCGLSQEIADTALSFHLPGAITEEKIDSIVDTLSTCVQKLQRMGGWR